MTLIRRAFYLIAGFTFPGFWAFHAAGYGGFLYRPVQRLFHTEATGWPSLLSIILLYLFAVALFEVCWRLVKNSRP